MNPQLPPNWLNACLDDELSPDDRAAATARLAASPQDQEELATLRELDQLLRQRLVAPEFDDASFLAALDDRRGEARQQAGASPAMGSSAAGGWQGQSRPASKLLAVTFVVMVLVAMGSIVFVQHWVPDVTLPPDAAHIAKVVRSVGQIEMQRPTETAWRNLDPHSASVVVAGTRLRTLPKSLCEVQTTSFGILRLNENTELIVHKAAEVEIISGELWCTTSADSDLTVVVPVVAPGPVPDKVSPEKPGSVDGVVTSFACPSNSPTQWSVSGEQIKCLSLSDKVAELTSPALASCSVQPNQWICVSPAEPSMTSGYVNRISASAWQLPLLSAGRPDDPELQSLLQSMLATLGRTKISSMYESQIRALGPAGTIPLIAFVRSSKSPESQRDRHEAMQIIADLAPESAQPDLEVLAIDHDPIVRRLATDALLRLTGRSKV